MVQGLTKARAVVYRSQTTGNLQVKIHEVEIVLVRDALAGYVIAGGVRYCETETSVLRKLQDAFSRTRIVLGTDSFRPTHSNVEPTVGDADKWCELVQKLAAHLRSL